MIQPVYDLLSQFASIDVNKLLRAKNNEAIASLFFVYSESNVNLSWKRTFGSRADMDRVTKNTNKFITGNNYAISLNERSVAKMAERQKYE